MRKSILFFIITVTACLGSAQNNQADIYCSVYTHYHDGSKGLLKTEGLVLDQGSADMITLPLEMSDGVYCVAAMFSANYTTNYKGVRCGFTAPLGDIEAPIIETSLDTAQSGVEGQFEDFSGHQFSIRCESRPPEQKQVYLNSDFVYYTEAPAILDAIHKATGSSGESARLETQDGKFALYCYPGIDSTNCSAEILPEVSISRRSLSVGVVGIRDGAEFLKKEIINPQDVSLLKKFLQGKVVWTSEQKIFIKKFGGTLEQIPATEISCSTISCKVTFNNYLLMER